MEPEIVINLWAIFDASVGMVYALSGKGYSVAGSDEEKLEILRRLSVTDYITAKRYKVPDRFRIVAEDGTEKIGITTLSAVYDINLQLFEDMVVNIEAELPPILRFDDGDGEEIKQVISDNPLRIVTVLYEDEVGNIRPITNDIDREWVTEQEEARGRLG